jgi:hypothetical protein
MAYEPKRLFVLGDTHGNLSWCKLMIEKALEEECDGILQLGDFGIWPKGDFVFQLNYQLDKAGLHLWFVDGNHEDFEQLLAIETDLGGKRTVASHITHLPRGHRWTWQGRKFLALGGAYSVDRPRRVKFVSWWPQETISFQDVERCLLKPDPVDVMVCHDAPAGSPALGPVTAGDVDRFPESYENRERVLQVVEAVRPSLLLHGHYHRCYSHRLPVKDFTVRVEGFACDDDGGAWDILDLESLTLKHKGKQ